MVASSEQPIAASGAWTRDDTFTLKLCLYETPFYSTMVFRFNGDQLLLDSENNVSFRFDNPSATGRRSDTK